MVAFYVFYNVIVLVFLGIFCVHFYKCSMAKNKNEYIKNTNITILFGWLTAILAVGNFIIFIDK